MIPTNHLPSTCIHLEEPVQEIWDLSHPGKTSSSIKHHFHRVCIDTGPQQSAIWQRQAEASCKRHKFKFELHMSATPLRFSYGSYPSYGSTNIIIPIPTGLFLSIEFHIVSADLLMPRDWMYWPCWSRERIFCSVPYYSCGASIESVVLILRFLGRLKWEPGRVW